MVSGQQSPFTCVGRVLAVDITHTWQTDSPDSISNILPVHPSNVDMATEVIEASVVVGNCHPYSVFAYECFTSWATYRPVLQHSLCPHMDCQAPEDLVLRATGICATGEGQYRQIDRPLVPTPRPIEFSNTRRLQHLLDALRCYSALRA